MRKLALALVALSTLAFAAPSFVGSAVAAPGMKVARADVVKVSHRRGHHDGWRAHRRDRKVVVIKRHRPHHGRTVVIKHRR
jgi:hypothetical protein